MKESGEIVTILLRTVASIYRHPKMHGESAAEIDTLLWHYHALWVEVMERNIAAFRLEVSRIHGRRHSCSLLFQGHYRNHTKKGKEASQDEVIAYVIKMWQKMDEKLGIDVPGP